MNKIICFLSVFLLISHSLFASYDETIWKGYYTCDTSSKYGEKVNKVLEKIDFELSSGKWFFNRDYTFGKLLSEKLIPNKKYIVLTKLDKNKLVWKDQVLRFIPIYNEIKKRYDQILFRLDFYDGKEIKKGGRTHIEDLYNENDIPKDNEIIKNRLIEHCLILCFK